MSFWDAVEVQRVYLYNFAFLKKAGLFRLSRNPESVFIQIFNFKENKFFRLS